MSSRGEQATVITGAELSYDDQFRIRRRRYAIMMGLRVPFLILATVLHQTPWLALAVIIISIPLPWIAVLVANDRPAKRTRMGVVGVINHERALPPGGQQVVDGGTELAGGER